MSNFFIGLFFGIIIGLAVLPIYKWVIQSFFTKKNGAGIVIVFLFMAIGLSSCGKTTGDPLVDTITFGQAWAHVAGFTSYWIWLVLSAFPLIVYILYLIKDKESQLQLPILFVCVALFAAGLLYAPAECAANTTLEQAARGVFIR